MALPHLDISRFNKGGRFNTALFSWALSRILGKAPYICVLDGFLSHPYDERQFFALIHSTAQHAAGLNGYNTAVKRPSFTKVRISPQEADSYSGVTGYSRTNLPLDLHTDSSYMPVPHDLIGFQCVEADTDGGENSYASIDELLPLLSKQSLTCLQESVYPFGKAEHAVISMRPEPTIRYYRGQLDHALEQGAELASHYKAALKELDNALQTVAEKNRFKLNPGQALVFNNLKALHGRTGFAEDSKRLLIRIRSHLNFDLLSKQKLPLWVKLGLYFAGSDNKKGASELIASAEQGTEIDDVPEYYEALQHSDHLDLDAITAMARQALRIGRLQEAHDLSTLCLDRDAGRIEALYNLAAITQFRGDKVNSENHLKNACKIRVYNSNFYNDGRPKLMTIRGLKGSKYTLLKKSNGYIKSVQRGHFSLQNLYQSSAFDKISASLFSELPKTTDKDGVPKPDLIVNTVACGDHMPETLKLIGRFCEQFQGVPIINVPEKVAAATRIGNHERLSRIDDVIYPKTMLVSLKHGMEEACSQAVIDKGLYFPLIIRPAGTHTGTGMALVHSEAELTGYFKVAEEGNYYAIQHHDLADKRGIYTKTRVFFVDGRLYTVAALMHNHWNVHSGDRYSVMDKNPWMQARERAYLKDIKAFYGESVVKALHAIRNEIQLDFFGIDFTVTDEGKLFVFEANAAMRHNFDHAGAFPYTRPYLQEVSSAFQRMLMRRAGILEV